MLREAPFPLTKKRFQPAKNDQWASEGMETTLKATQIKMGFTWLCLDLFAVGMADLHQLLRLALPHHNIETLSHFWRVAHTKAKAYVVFGLLQS